MQFRNLATGEILDLNSDDSRIAIDNPNLSPISTQIMAKDSDGQTYSLTPDQFKEAKSQGASIELHTDVDEAKESFKGLGGGLLAAGAGALSGATLGLSDIALTKTGLVAPATLEGLKEAHPIANVAGELAGTVGTALIPGVNVALGAKLAGTGAKALAKRAIAGGVTTGLQQTLSAEAVRETPFAVERLAKDFATNAIVGTIAGAGLEGAFKLASKAAPIASLLPGAGLSKADEAIWSGISKLAPGDEAGRKAVINQLSPAGKAQLWMNEKTAALSSVFTGGSNEAAVDMLTSRSFRDSLRDKAKGVLEKSDLTQTLARVKGVEEAAKKSYRTNLVDAVKANIDESTASELTSVVDSFFPTAANLVDANKDLYSTQLRLRVKNLDKYAKAQQKSWGKSPELIADGIIDIRKMVNKDIKQFHKMNQIAGKATSSDQALVEQITKDSDQFVNILTGGKEDVLVGATPTGSFKLAESDYANWKKLQRTLKSITNKDKNTLEPGKVTALLKNKNKYADFMDSLNSINDAGGLKDELTGLSNQIQRYAQARALVSNQGREGLSGILGSVGIGALGTPVLGAASLMVTNPALYLRALDMTKDVVSAGIKPIATAMAPITGSVTGSIALRSPVDKFAERLVNDWRKKGQYEAFLDSLSPEATEQAQMAVANDPNLQGQPELTQQVAEKTGQVYNALQQKAPKLVPSVLNPGQANRPSNEELRRYARVVSAILFPEEALKRAQFNKEYADSLAGVFDEHLKLLNDNPSTIPGQELAGTQQLQSLLYSKQPEGTTGAKPNTGGKLTIPTTQTYKVSGK